MQRTPRPEDFFGEDLPDRIIGTEMEYTVQGRKGSGVSTYVGEETSKKIGIRKCGDFSDDGFKTYGDVGDHAEIATPEALGPHEAAAAYCAGTILLQRLVSVSGLPTSGVYCNTGTRIDGLEPTYPATSPETSRGHHQNYLIARDLANDSLMKTVVSSHLASRGVWAMAGMVGSGGYTLSQKASGIGEPLQQGLGRRTDHGRKPLAVIPTTNDDTVTPDSGWARLEVRYADACISATGQFLDLASTSLTLRLVEQRQKVDIKELEAMAFRDIVHAVKVFSNDLSLGGVTVRANDQRRVSAVDYQEALIAEARKLSEKVELPADEVLAIELWQTVCDELRRADLNKGEYGQLPRMLDFAARHLALRRRYEPEEINSHNYEAVAYHLRWDRILPDGYGLRYWARQPSEYVSAKDVESLLEVPPLTRATARRKAFGMGLLDGMGWSHYAVLAGKTRRTMPLPDPYSSDLLQGA